MYVELESDELRISKTDNIQNNLPSQNLSHADSNLTNIKPSKFHLPKKKKNQFSFDPFK